jgi:hypothetical protein
VLDEEATVLDAGSIVLDVGSLTLADDGVVVLKAPIVTMFRAFRPALALLYL